MNRECAALTASYFSGTLTCNGSGLQLGASIPAGSPFIYKQFV